MRRKIFCIIVLVYSSTVSAQQPPDPGSYYAGIYADESRLYNCISGPEGSGFEQYIWAWIPLDTGLNYITLRFLFPSNVDMSSRPVFNDLMTHLEVVDYGPGGVEWTVLFAGCPSGWILIFSQECIFLDTVESSIGLSEPFSFARNCQFVIHDIHVLNNLSLNNPGCIYVPAGASTWGAIKSIYQH